jgi:hypothetical protein
MEGDVLLLGFELFLVGFSLIIMLELLVFVIVGQLKQQIF